MSLVVLKQQLRCDFNIAQMIDQSEIYDEVKPSKTQKTTFQVKLFKCHVVEFTML